jgi:hypothetical protein
MTEVRMDITMISRRIVADLTESYSIGAGVTMGNRKGNGS